MLLFCIVSPYTRQMFLPFQVVKTLTVIQLLFHAFLGMEACTEIRLTATDNSVVVGRTMEYGYDLSSNLVVEPKGQAHSAAVAPGCPPNPMSWTNAYSIGYLDAWNTFLPADAMNTAGLSVGPLLFPGFAQYQVWWDILVRDKPTFDYFRVIRYFSLWLFRQHFFYEDNDGNKIVRNLHIWQRKSIVLHALHVHFPSFGHFADVLVLSMFCSCLDDLSIWGQMLNFSSYL